MCVDGFCRSFSLLFRFLMVVEKFYSTHASLEGSDKIDSEALL